MQILVYGISNQKGGISEFMMNLNKNMLNKDISFNYIIKGKDSVYAPLINKMNGKVFYYNYRNKIERLTNLYKIIKKERSKTNIFYYNTSGTYFVFPIIFAKLLGYKIISHAHGGKDRNINKAFELLNIINRNLLNIVSSVKFTCSDVAKEWVYGNAKNVIQVNNAIDQNIFFYDSNLRKEIRKLLGVSTKDIVMINVGRVEYPKNQKFLINLMVKLNKSEKNFKLLLVGNGTDLENLKKYVRDKKINNICFLGQRTDVNNLLNASDLLLLPSFYEGFPIVSVEAQATGLPCILSNTITKSSNITNLVSFLSLNEEDWINSIMNFKVSKRTDMNHILKENGFDENSICEKVYDQINKIYEGSYDN
ncbi:glycosyltransferase [Streptococcus suis]|nr:glycosyltransferase [Streptococcus suis]